MASTINATTTSGVAVAGDTSGQLQLQTNNGTTAVTIDTAQNVGIGTTSPTSGYKLDVRDRARVASTSNYVLDLIGSGSNGSTIQAYADNSLAALITTGTSAVPMAFFTNGTERMRIDSSGNVGINSTNPDFASSGDKLLNITGTSTRATVLLANTSTGTSGVAGSVKGYNGSTFLTSIDLSADGATNSGKVQIYTANAGSTVAGPYVSHGGTSWTSSSDERFKDIIEPITDGLNKVSSLRAIIGKFKTDEEGTRRSFLIAQDVQAVLPEAVINTDPEHLGLNYTDVIPLLVASIKELNAKVDAQATTIATLQAKLGA